MPGVLGDWADPIQEPRASGPWAPAVFDTTSLKKFPVIPVSSLQNEILGVSQFGKKKGNWFLPRLQSKGVLTHTCPPEPGGGF